MFDFANVTQNRLNFSIKFSCVILERYSKIIQLKREQQIKTPDSYLLFDINKDTAKITGIKTAINIAETFCNNDGFEIKEGDEIIAGRISLFFLTLRNNNQIEKIKNNDETFDNDSPKCRVCLSGSNDGDILVSPCSCTGSVKYIHYSCLLKWVRAQIVYFENESGILLHVPKEFQCELCKNPINLLLSINDFDFLNNFSFYIVFKCNIKEKTMYEWYYLINFEGQTVKMGRSNKNDIVFSDDSVSREHFIIWKEKGRIFIKDCESKYGTLVKMSNSILLLPYKKLSIFFTKTEITFIMKRTLLGFLSCINPKKDKRDYNFFINKTKDFQAKGTHKELVHGSDAELMPERIVTTINETKREGPLIKKEEDRGGNFDEDHKEEENKCSYLGEVQEDENPEVDSPKVLESNDSIIHNEIESNFNFGGNCSKSRNRIRSYNSERNKAINFSATLYKNFNSNLAEQQNKTIKEENNHLVSRKLEKKEIVFSNRNNNSTEILAKTPGEIN